MNTRTTLRTMRIEKRLTQLDVAKKMKVSQAYYSMIETGEKPSEVSNALLVVNGMRRRSDRTAGGSIKAGRAKS